jgi:hypothetical protein
VILCYNPAMENAKTTTADKSAADRAHEAFNRGGDCDWNEETQEFNPYPLGSQCFHVYQEELARLNREFYRMFPDF